MSYYIVYTYYTYTFLSSIDRQTMRMFRQLSNRIIEISSREKKKMCLMYKKNIEFPPTVAYLGYNKKNLIWPDCMSRGRSFFSQ